MITGGESFNSVAAEAKLTLDIRTASAEDKKQLLEIEDSKKKISFTKSILTIQHSKSLQKTNTCNSPKKLLKKSFKTS